VQLAAGTIEPGGPRATREAAAKFLVRVRELVGERRFLHWQVAFPGVWENWESITPVGGFDAVIGNPPWDRMKLQEAEWFAARFPDIARTERSSDRTKLIADKKRKSADSRAILIGRRGQQNPR
jgi:hypothetical protein